MEVQQAQVHKYQDKVSSWPSFAFLLLDRFPY